MKLWYTEDKTDWPKGEWDFEPDKMQWVDEETGLDCLIVRGTYGQLCGYVGVPATNPYFEKDCMDIVLSVHGGLTFSDRCMKVEFEGNGICHSGDDIANAEVWWLGFDCAHGYDLCPKRMFPKLFAAEEYRNVHYVMREVKSLAQQLAN